MGSTALIMMLVTWSLIIFFTSYFFTKALKNQGRHNSGSPDDDDN